VNASYRAHNDYGRRKTWWRRYFWSRDEYWAKFAVYRAAHQARNAAIGGNGRYFFWNRVCLSAADYCAKTYGPIPGQLLKRPIAHDAFALSTPEVNRWLKVEPPYKRRSRLLRSAQV
jgi:hypothetical protein